MEEIREEVRKSVSKTLMKVLPPMSYIHIGPTITLSTDIPPIEATEVANGASPGLSI